MDKKKIIKNISFGVALAFIGAFFISVIAGNFIGVYSVFFDSSSNILSKFIALSMIAMIDVGSIFTVLEFKDANEIRKNVEKKYGDKTSEKEENQSVKLEEKKLEKVLNNNKGNNVNNNKSYNYDNIIDG